MEYYLAIYPSVSLANMVKKNMPVDGSYLSVVHTPKSLTTGGCSYALRFKRAKLAQIKEKSKQLGINIKAIYKETNVNGNITYQKL